ncbi:DUF7527 domain-containing protein [Halorubrum tibetense]|uniref:DUF7527 domain-containing protein n=1 Tax=Halorubrum tibetense TaxID=175631 RepID=A0ABD5S9L3_9EURY
MDAQRKEEVTGWDARTFSDGFDGLREFTDRGFSGAATDGTGWLFFLDGRVVGTVDADLDAFTDASGTAYEAPDEALPLLFAMQEQGGEKRAQYYTNDTPLSAADRKLSEGGFTGYVELAENVLSGDYYVAYAAGESMAAAYVGNSRRLETGEKAFDLADDEVGIYTVYEVDLDVRELPAGTQTGSGEEQADGDDGESADDAGNDLGIAPAEPRADDADRNDAGSDADSGTDVSTDSDTDAATDTDPGRRRNTVAGSSDSDGPASEEEPVVPGEESGSDRSSESVDAAGNTAGTDGVSSGRDGSGTRASNPTEAGTSASAADGAERDESTAGSTGVGDDSDTGGERTQNRSVSASSGRETDASTRTDSGDGGAPVNPDDDVFSEEAEWREAKSIPALDPSETNVRGEGGSDGTDGSRREGRQRANTSGRTRTGPSSEGRSGSDQRRSEAGGDRSSPEPRSTGRGTSQAAVSKSSGGSEAARERIDELESALAELSAERESLAEERDELEAELDAATERRESIAAERDELETERNRLEAEVEELRSEVERLRDRLAEAESQLPDADRTISPAEAREGTNLFIRYDSKGGATLDDAHDGSVSREELRDNLRIEHHTSFETDGLQVDGRPYGAFLRDTMEFGFTRWLVEELPFEVGETGNASALRELYDALPEIDRAEIGGAVSIVSVEDGEEVREQRPFDLVLRDRMGNPLFVADLNDTRAPTAGGTLESLVANGGTIAESNDEFAGVFAVTASFFEPDALEAASDAVGGGLFNRSKRKSFVKLSRKRGYHLCLVESRDGGFHLTVPDL